MRARAGCQEAFDFLFHCELFSGFGRKSGGTPEAARIFFLWAFARMGKSDIVTEDVKDMRGHDSRQMSLGGGEATEPLAARLRPRSLDEFAGQRHLLGEGGILRSLIENDKISSMIFWGPPGVGKTTLARIIANRTRAEFIDFSAVTSGIREIRDVMRSADANGGFGGKTILFVDEIHRFNKAQQDAFLPFVEKGSIILIGATTENPSFEINGALLSRCRVFVLKPLETEEIVGLLSRALEDGRGFGKTGVDISGDLLLAIANFANGDARSALSTLEMAVLNSPRDSSGRIEVSREIVEQCVSRKSLLYDKTGEEHYNLISALHKSMRNSDPDAAVYWLARMIEGGEDPLFIARRLVILAGEDIGLANPNAMLLANATFDVVHKIGMPEGRIPLAECTVYLATSPKSNSAYMAIDAALAEVRKSGNLPVPLHIRNAPTSLMKELGYHANYKYAHDYPGNFVRQQFLPDAIANARFWNHCDNPPENRAAELQAARWGNPKQLS